MKKPSSNHIADHRRRRNMSQQQLADAMNVHWTTISKLERGITRLDFDTAEQISSVLDVDMYDLIPRKPLVHISLSGYIHHGGDVEEIDEDEHNTLVINSTMFYDLETFWVSVVKDALYPYFKDGDILGISWINDEERRDENGNLDYTAFFGRFCLVEDQQHRMFMGIISAGRTSKTIDLLNANYPPLRDIEPKSLGQVTVTFMATPAMRVQRRPEGR